MRRFLVWAVAAILGLPVLPAFSADLGGDCCADLEERVSELEATTARKGNRKMSVTITGEVNQAYLWVDTPFGTDDAIIDNGSELVIKGEGNLRPGSSIGYVIDIDFDAVDGDLDIDKAYVWFRSEIGTLSLGQRDHASDGTGQTAVANTKVGAPLLEVLGLAAPDGDDAPLARYDSPLLGPLMASASWSTDDEWSVALRAAQEFGGLRIAASVGYWADDVGFNTLTASAGIMHMTSGLFVQGGYADIDGAADIWHIQGGLERNVIGYGATTLYGEYGNLAFGPIDLTGWGFGLVQALDPVSTDLYVSYRTSDDLDATVIIGGARVKF